MPDQLIVQQIREGGAWALLVAIAVWLGGYLVPKVLAAFRDRDSQFLSALDRRDAAAEKNNVLVGAKLDRLADKVDVMAGEVRTLRTDFDAHADDCRPAAEPRGK